MNDMNNIMCYMNYDMCYVYVIVCFVQYVKYDDACYSHRITFLIQIWRAHKRSQSKFRKLINIPNPNFVSSLTFQISIWQGH